MQGMAVHKREAVPHGAADDRIRVVLRQDRAEHVERTDIGRGLTAPIRIRRKNEIYERLPNHFSIALLAIIPSTKHTPLHSVYLSVFRG